MCVDYRQLNKATPVDAYPMPRTDELIDESVVSHVLSMRDKLEKMKSLADVNLENAQRQQKRWCEEQEISAQRFSPTTTTNLC